MARMIVDDLRCSPINSTYVINLSLDQRWGKHICINITIPAILRQYVGEEVVCGTIKDAVKIHYTYGSGTGAGSVGMDPYNL